MGTPEIPMLLAYEWISQEGSLGIVMQEPQRKLERDFPKTL